MHESVLGRFREFSVRFRPEFAGFFASQYERGHKLTHPPVKLCDDCGGAFLQVAGMPTARCGECRRKRANALYLAKEHARKALDIDAYQAKSREETRKWREAHPEYKQPPLSMEATRAAKLKTKYGISIALYDALLAEQGGCCGICGAKSCKTGRRLAVDHDHSTGRVRGLLCNLCNTALGKLGDSVESLERAIAYLKATANA
jgi:hypothetical protein